MWVRGREVKGEQKIIYGIYTTSSLSLCLFFFFRTTFGFYLLSDTFHVHDFNLSFFFIVFFIFYAVVFLFRIGCIFSSLLLLYILF